MNKDTLHEAHTISYNIIKNTITFSEKKIRECQQLVLFLTIKNKKLLERGITNISMINLRRVWIPCKVLDYTAGLIDRVVSYVVAGP